MATTINHTYLVLCCLLASMYVAISVPIQRSASDHSSTFCRAHTTVNQVYNIGNDVFIVQNSMSIHKFDAVSTQLDAKKKQLNQLFGKNKFQWVDTVISLAGFCEKSPLCSDETWNILNDVNIVIGNRRLSNGEKTYGYALYMNHADKKSFQQITLANASQSLSNLLTKIGMPLKDDETEASLMIGDFWPKYSDNLYYQSGLFFPERGEIIFNVYENRAPLSSRRIIRRKFSNDASNDWNTLETLDSPDFKGMFRLNGKSYTVDKKNIIREILWNKLNQIEFKNLGSIHEFVNCYNNSTLLNEGNKKLIEKADPVENLVKENVEKSTKVVSTTPTQKIIEQTSTTTAATTTTTTTTTTISSTSKLTEPEVEVFKADPHSHLVNEIDASGEIREKEEDENELGISNKNFNDPDGIDDFQSSQSDDPRSHIPTLAEASARGPFNPSDDGLIWTFSILIGVLILLTIIILIPILIIRHNARTDRMYLNKTKKPIQSSQNSEEVQLMNSSNIDK